METNPPSKTIVLDKRPSFAGNLVTIFAGQAERTAESMALRQNLPGRSHVGKTLLNDNTSQDRLLEMRLADIRNAKRKTAALITHQKNTFIARMEHRQNTWVREHAQRVNNLNSLASRRQCVAREDETVDPKEEQRTDAKDMTVRKGNDSNLTLEWSTKSHNALPSIATLSPKRNCRNPGNDIFQHRPRSTENHLDGLSLPSVHQSQLVLHHRRNADRTTIPTDNMITDDLVKTDREIVRGNEDSTNRSFPKERDIPLNKQKRSALPLTASTAEVLPKIQIREGVRLRSHKAKNLLRHREKRAPHKVDGDPLTDDRFLNLQHTLAPHLVCQKSVNFKTNSFGNVISANDDDDLVD